MIEYTRAVYANRLVLFLTIGFAVVTSAWLAGILPKLYEARASFYVPVVQDIFSLSMETGGTARAVPAPTVVRDQLRGYFGILTSGRVAARVAESIPERSVEQIQRGTRFQLTTAGMFLITGVDRDPVIAARIANAFADSFNDLFEEISQPRVTKTRRFIEEQLKQVKQDLLTADGNLETFKQAHKTVSLAEETSQLVKLMTDFRIQADQTTVSLDEVRTRIRAIEQRMTSEAKMQLSSTQITTNPLVQRLQGKVSDLEVELAGLRAKFTPLHPDVLQAEQQIRETRQLMQEEVARILASETHSLNPVYENLRQNLATLYADERAAAAKWSALQEILRHYEEEMKLLPELQSQLAELTRTLRHFEETDRMLALKLEDARIQEKREITTFLVVDRAVPARNPAYPNPLLSVPAAGVLGTVAGVFYAMLFGYLKARRARSMTQGKGGYVSMLHP